MDSSSNTKADTEFHLNLCNRAMSERGTCINDAVHGAIVLPKLCLDFINTPEFQRLRDLKQCGVCHLVYPSATHSRFEHSIGVCHVAHEFVQLCGDRIPDDKKLCIILAGLCHDLGHGPFSHLWETFLKKLNVNWKHESSSHKIFRYLVAKNGLESKMLESGLNEKHIDLICNIIDGTVPEYEKDVYLYEIIANKETGLDVDKLEYIRRDAKQFGMPFSIDLFRILLNVGIIEEENEFKHIGFRDKVEDDLRDVFVYRAKLHQKCYQHVSCKAVELMLIDALVAANDHFFITTYKGKFKMSNCHEDVEAFLKASDYIYYNLLYSTNDNLRESRRLLEAITNRDLYNLVMKQDIIEENIERLNEMLKHFDTLEDFRYCFVSFSIGQGADPVSKVKFFSKTGQKLNMNFSTFVKEDYQHKKLLIFTTKGKKSTSNEEMQKIKAYVQETYNKYMIDHHGVFEANH